MTSFEERWARVIGRALLPRGLLAGVVDDSDLGALWRDECVRARWDGAFLLRLSLWLTWLAPLWLYGRLRTFGGLDARAQAAVLHRLLVHKQYLVRTTATFLKLTLCQVLLGDEATLAQLGAYQLRPRSLLRKAS